MRCERDTLQGWEEEGAMVGAGAEVEVGAKARAGGGVGGRGEISRSVLERGHRL